MFLHPRDVTHFQTLKQSAKLVFQLLENTIQINTFFIAINDRKTNYFIETFNQKETLVEAGSTLPFDAVF
ncbi:hypothetical protein [Bacillus pinisoli]|uniref:hypothetical protein n=1 Tax=Bacillus pinisoli TaxID=2901866 RepID=UPI001FF1E9BE|nr:hypothetical protein [Bacillus pinisoli]